MFPRAGFPAIFINNIYCNILVLVLLATLGEGAKKCCGAGDALVSNGSSLVCEGSEDFNCTEGQFCVDVSTEGRIFQVFCNGSYHAPEILPKCCPIGLGYNKKRHDCVPFPEGANYNASEIGLSQCLERRVVLDFISEDLQDALVLEGRLELNGREVEADQLCFDDEVITGKYVIRACVEDDVCGEANGGVSCLRKCCPDGYHYGLNHTCERFPQNEVNWDRLRNSSEIQDNFGIIHGSSCKKYVATSNIDYKIDEWGNLHLKEKSVLKTYKPYEEMYCVERVEYRNKSLSEDMVLLCVLPPAQRFHYTRVAMLISCVFIALTIVIYVWLLEKLNFFSKALISYCTSLFLMYALLAYVQFNMDIKRDVCTGIAYAVTFFAVSTFVWMNIMCIDIWLTFGSPNNLLTASQKRKERKRLFWYSTYGWGLPLLMVLFTLLAKEYDFLPLQFRPLLGEFKCLLYSSYENYYKLVFYVVPITILKITDLVLFLKTILHCLKIKSAINELKGERSCDKKKWFIADKERLSLLIKLFVVMGVSWLGEVLTSIIRFDTNPVLVQIETVWDVFNCLQGVFIFLIFAFKQEVLNNLKRKWRSGKLRRTSLSSAMTQSSTLITKNKTCLT